MNEQKPLSYGVAARAEVRCIANTVSLLAHRRMHLPTAHVGMRLRFADGSSARVYRETVVDGEPVVPCVLLVEFRLRLVRGWGHTLFRWESLLNTPLFVGFPGFVSKLWLAHDEHGVYRGLYEWDGSDRAEQYARSLWRVLALVSVPGSIHYRVIANLRRDELLASAQQVVSCPVKRLLGGSWLNWDDHLPEMPLNVADPTGLTLLALRTHDHGAPICIVERRRAPGSTYDIPRGLTRRRCCLGRSDRRPGIVPVPGRLHYRW